MGYFKASYPLTVYSCGCNLSVTTATLLVLVINGTCMQGVHVIYEPEAGIPWDLRADTGTIPPSANIIQLTGNVVAATQDDDKSSMTIRTSYLELDTETYIANTSRKVTVDYSQHTVFATGMRAYFKEDRLELISDVDGKFLP